MAKSRPQGAGYTEASEAFLEEKIPTETVPGLSVAVVKGGRIIWNRGFGFADLATSTPATPSDELPVVLDDEDRNGHGDTAASRARGPRSRRPGRRVLSRLQDRVAADPRECPTPPEPQLRSRQSPAAQVGVSRRRPGSRPARLRKSPTGQASQTQVRPRRACQLLESGLPGAGGGHLRGLWHEVRGIRTRGDPLSPRDEAYRLRLPGARETVERPPAINHCGNLLPRSSGPPCREA